MKILCGQEFLSFDDCENVFEQLNESLSLPEGALNTIDHAYDEPNIENSQDEIYSEDNEAQEIPDAFP